MKPVAILLAGLLTGCAYTELRDPNTGKRVFKTQADAKNVTYRNGSTYFHAEELNHSTPTLAQGKAASDKIGAAASAATALGIGNFLTK